MKIGITLKPQSYTPEAFAYQEYLETKGWNVQLALEKDLDPNNDINIYFMGTRPFWKKKEGNAKEIHEYQSLSVPNYSKIKDFLKKLINRKPDGRIFLNSNVEDILGFQDNIPSIQRDMGIDKSLFQTPNVNPEYDIVYSGSILGREGLIQILLRFASLGFKILVIGEIPNNYLSTLKHSNIFLTGKVSREDLPKLYKNCKAGLNYTPDIYPFNIQTSTKTLEYLASGLRLISNTYGWINNFTQKESIKYIKIEKVKEYIEIDNKIYNYSEKMEKYNWEMILKESKFDSFLKGVINEKL